MNNSTFIHFSKHPDLTILHGGFNGSGIKGAEDERVRATQDPRIKKRIYFYPALDGDVLPRPEVGLGHFAYSAQLNNLFDARKSSPDGNQIALKKNMYVARGEDPGNAFERAILDAGFDGYRTDNLAVVLSKDVPVKFLGSSIGKTFGNHSFTKDTPKSVFDGVPNKSGEHSSSILTPSQVTFWLKHQAAMKSAAPSVRLEYGRLVVHGHDLPALKQCVSEIPGNPF